jgi:hypothetical protein
MKGKESWENLDSLPDVSSIIEFSKRLPGGVPTETAKSFLRYEKAQTALTRFQGDGDMKHLPRPAGMAVNLGMLALYFDDGQKNAYINGYELLVRLIGKPVLNAEDLAYLVKNPRDIPKDWEPYDNKGHIRRFYFFGSVKYWIGPRIPYLESHHGRWQAGTMSLTADWGLNDPIVIYKP